MKKWQKEIENVLLDDEEEVLKKLEKTYKQSLKGVKKHAKELQNDLDKLIADDPDNENLIRSKVYQLNYQKALEKQINGYMDVIKRDNVKDINDYLKTVYSDGFMTQQYGLMKQGVSITMPINQKLLVKSITYKTEDIPLSTRIYKNVEKAKTTIISEISRGLSTGMSVNDIARNLENSMGVSSRKAYQLAQNEGARVRKDATIDCIKEAKKKGADLVKMWDATMDSKTRPIHAELHGKWAEVDEKFEYSGGEVFAPKEFGVPALDINCRCALLSVPRWDVDDNARHYDNAWRENGNDKMYVDVKNYEDWKKLYGKTDDPDNDLPESLKNFKNYSDDWHKKEVEPYFSETQEEYMTQAVEKLLDNNSYCMRFKVENLESIMDKGFLNQMETGSSNGALNENLRKKAGSKLFGYDPNELLPQDFEKYGYLGNNDFTDDNNYKLTQYGNVIVHFNKEKVKTTYLFGDSLNCYRYEDAIGGGTNSSLETNINGILDKERFMEGVMIYGDNVLNSANEALRLAPKDVEYIELQYHGQLSFDSVTEIMFQYNEKPSDEIIKKLKDKGIKVYIKEKRVAHEI